VSKHSNEQIVKREAYEEVRLEGQYNMFSPNARDLTGLSKEEYSYCMENYSSLKEQAIAKAEEQNDS